MLLSLENNLEDRVIVALAGKGGQTVKGIRTDLKKNAFSFTEQGIYRVLRKLQKDGVVVKEKKTYSLQILWILELAGLINSMEDTYLQRDYLGQLLPKIGQRHVWYFTNLQKMNDFWTQLLLAMAKQSETGISLNYSPHTWYILLQKARELQFSKTFLEQLKHSYMIIGSRSYLDQYAKAILSDAFSNEEHYLAQPDECIEKDTSLYIDLIDDYILTLRLDPAFTETIERIYKEITVEKDVDSIDILKFYSDKIRVKITLKKDPKKAAMYRKRFEKIFGPLK